MTESIIDTKLRTKGRRIKYAYFFCGLYSSNPTEFSDQGYSVSELKSLNKENNEKFSDFKFVFGFFIRSWSQAIILLLIISLPFIYSYYEDKKEEELIHKLGLLEESEK